jgi:RNA polymerase-binding transcription factor DksA
VADTDPNDIDVHDVPGTTRTPAPDVDLDAVERDLAAVEIALERLSDGTYWTDEVTGEPIADQVLADDPTARRS